MTLARIVLPALCAVLLGLPGAAVAQPATPSGGAQACRSGTLLQGRALPRALGDKGFRATLPLASGAAAGEVRFQPDGKLVAADGRRGEWELTEFAPQAPSFRAG